jgi:hypothetical protein
MLIKYLTEELITQQKDYKQILFAKLWPSQFPYNFAVGRVGTKKKDTKEWNFSEITLHPDDRLYLKKNKWKRSEKDPEYLLYVGNSKKENLPA